MKRLIILLISTLILNNIYAQKYTTEYITDANQIGFEWFKKVNSGDFDNAYNKLSSTLKNRFSKESWHDQISELMSEVGDFEKRTVRDTYFQSELEGFEDGFYVIIEYSAEYTKTKNHIEILLLKQSDQLIWEIYEFIYEFQTNETNLE